MRERKGKQEYFYKRLIVVSLLLLIFGLLIIKKRGFMAVTGHFIDDSWTLKSCILR
jgi:hypothetical protein